MLWPLSLPAGPCFSNLILPFRPINSVYQSALGNRIDGPERQDQVREAGSGRQGKRPEHAQCLPDQGRQREGRSSQAVSGSAVVIARKAMTTGFHGNVPAILTG